MNCHDDGKGAQRRFPIDSFIKHPAVMRVRRILNILHTPEIHTCSLSLFRTGNSLERNLNKFSQATSRCLIYLDFHVFKKVIKNKLYVLKLNLMLSTARIRGIGE